MGDFGKQQDSADWAEEKKIARKCPNCGRLMDNYVGCNYCNTPHAPMDKTIFNPFRMAKLGYKFHAGSYWKKISHNETANTKGITLTDSEGIWLKVSMEEATVELEIKEPPVNLERIETTIKLESKETTVESKSNNNQQYLVCPICNKNTLQYGTVKGYLYYKCLNLVCKEIFGKNEILKFNLPQHDIGEVPEVDITEPTSKPNIIEEPSIPQKTNKRAPIWEKLYTPETKDSENTKSQPPVSSQPSTPDVKTPTQKPQHPSFGEDLRRMIFGK